MLTNLVNISFIAQGILLLISIGLVWYQLRENTRLIRISNAQKLVELSSPFNLQLAQDRALAELWLQGTRGLDQLDEVDRERYFNLLTWWLVLHESIYHQWSKKLIEQDTYMSWSRDLEYFARRQNLQNHWSFLHSYFESSFADHVTTLMSRQAEEAV